MICNYPTYLRLLIRKYCGEENHNTLFPIVFQFQKHEYFLTILQMSYNQYYAAIDIHISTNTNILNKTETDIRFRQI